MRNESVGGNQLEITTLNVARKASLGESLVAARELRGLSREAVARETRIPAHYLQMLEDDDYRLISDRLYLMPFLRKYATFLEIDQDETAMRLVHEVLRADNNPSPVQPDEPLDDIRHYRQRDWSKLIIFSGLIAIIIGAYIVQSRHNETDTTPTVKSLQAAAVPSPSAGLKGAVNPVPATHSSNTASASRLDSSVLQQSISVSTTSAPQRTQSMSR